MLEFASLGLGAIQSLLGLSGLNKLHEQPDPKYTETPELKASRLRADEMAKRGFTPEEMAARDQKLTRAENTGYVRSLDVAPNQAQAVLAGTNYANVAAQGDIASRDADLHRRNIQYSDSYAKILQNIADKNIATQEQNRRAAEASLGGAVSSGLNNITGAINLAQVTGGVGGKQVNPSGGTGTNAVGYGGSTDTSYNALQQLMDFYKNRNTSPETI